MNQDEQIVQIQSRNFKLISYKINCILKKMLILSLYYDIFWWILVIHNTIYNIYKLMSENC